MELLPISKLEDPGIYSMRVLWFTNCPLLPVTRHLVVAATVSGGWMGSLASALHSYPDLDLGAVSTSETDYPTFEADGVQYFNVHSLAAHGSMAAIYRRWFPDVEVTAGVRKCLEIIETFKPDVIHIHGTEEYYGLLSEKTSVPIVISVQGILALCELFYYGGFSCKDKLRDAFSFQFLRGVGLFHQHRYMKKLAGRERQIFKSCDHFIGRTQFDRDFVGLMNPDAAYYHCDEILRPVFYSREWCSPRSSKFTIFCISSGPAPLKGLDCLFHACKILKSNGIDNIELRIAGPIQNAPTWHILRRKIREPELSPDMVWLGPSSAETIASELERSNAFVLPSYVENSPNSLAEAMLIGTPCVAASAGGVPSLLTHGKDGLLFQPGDAYSLAGLLARIRQEPSLARSLSENAKTTARARHNPKKVVARMMEIYAAVRNHSLHENNRYTNEATHP